MTRTVPRWVSVLVMASVMAVAGCSSDDDDSGLSDKLRTYTDAGDGCRQAVVAITYADALLKDAGQEQYQDFPEAVRTRIGTVAGTIALEAEDFPSERTYDQAQRVAGLARKTAAREASGQRRVRLLREYRVEAMKLVLDCAREVPELRRPG